MPSTLTRSGLASLAALAGLAASGAHAADFNAIGALNQTEFRALSKDLAAATSFKGLVPAEGLGITGFDIGVALGATSVSSREVLVKAAGGSDIPKAVPYASVRAVKGLPFDIDIGAAVTTLPGTNARAIGGELRWAFVGGDMVLPAVAVRLSASQLQGVDQLKIKNAGAELMISKGILFATPYAGIGTVQSKASAPGTSLAAEKMNLSKVFAGVNLAFIPFSINIEADKTGSATSIGAKFGVRF
jgi:hypothetical protein